MNGFDFLEDIFDFIYVKFVDYGVSRIVQLLGTKGFGGILLFIVLEIFQFVGKVQYIEKVGCEIIYEILLLN